MATFKPVRIQRNLRIEQARNRAARFGFPRQLSEKRPPWRRELWLGIRDDFRPTVGPLSSISSFTAAVVSIFPDSFRLCQFRRERIEKHPACAAAMSSSGLVPMPFSKRERTNIDFLQHSAFAGDSALSGFQIADPNADACES